MTAPQEILVLRPNDLGDLLTATPIFDALRRTFPTTRIIAGVGSWGRAIVANNPNIDEVVELDVPWNNKFVPDRSWRAAAQFLASSSQISALREGGGFDAGIDLLGSHVGALLMLRLGVRFRVGIRGYRGGWSACYRFSKFSSDVHVSQAALNQAALLGATDQPEARPQLYLTASERDAASTVRKTAGEAPGIRLLVGCGGGIPEKCFPPDALGEVLARLAVADLQEGQRLNILLTGGPADVDRVEKVRSYYSEGVISVCGKLSLRETFSLVEQADLVIIIHQCYFTQPARFTARLAIMSLCTCAPAPFKHASKPNGCSTANRKAQFEPFKTSTSRALPAPRW